MRFDAVSDNAGSLASSGRGINSEATDSAALIELHAGAAVTGLAVKEPATMVGNGSDRLIDVLSALLLEDEYVFYRHGASYAGPCPGGGGMGGLEL